MEDINPRIVKKIWDSDFAEEIKKFLIFAIRQELAHCEHQKWKYTEVYDKEIKKRASD